MFKKRIAKNVAILLALLLAFSVTTGFAYGRVLPAEESVSIVPFVATTGPALSVTPASLSLIFNHSIPRDVQVDFDLGAPGYEATGITSVALVGGSNLPSSAFSFVDGQLTIFSNWFLVNTTSGENIAFNVIFNDAASTIIYVPVTITDTRIVVAHGSFDDVGLILNRLNIAFYQLPSGQTARLNNPAFINSFDMVFLPCGVGSLQPQVIRDFVANGGILYASDLVLGGLLTPAFPEMGFTVSSASAQTTPGTIVDTGLAALFSSRFHSTQFNVIYNLGGWQFLTGWNAEIDVLIEGPIAGRPVDAVYPFTFTFNHGQGRVLYTSFHTHVQTNAQMDVIMEYLITRLVFDDYVTQLEDVAEDYGFDSISTLIGTIPANSFLTFVFVAQAGQSFIVLNNINVLINFTIVISGPGGITFTSVGITPAFEAFVAENIPQYIYRDDAQGLIVHNPTGGEWTIRVYNDSDVASDFVMGIDGFVDVVVPQAPQALFPWPGSRWPVTEEDEVEAVVVEGPMAVIVNGVSIYVELTNRQVVLELPVNVATRIIEASSDDVLSFDLTMQPFDTVVFPSNILRRFAEAGLAIELHLPLGTIFLDAYTVYSIGMQARTRFVTFSLTRVALDNLSEAQYVAVEEKNVSLFQVSIDFGGFTIDEVEGEITVSVFYVSEYPSSVWSLDYYGALQLLELLEVEALVYYVSEYCDEVVELQVASFVLEEIGIFALGTV